MHRSPVDGDLALSLLWLWLLLWLRFDPWPWELSHATGTVKKNKRNYTQKMKLNRIEYPISMGQFQNTYNIHNWCVSGRIENIPELIILNLSTFWRALSRINTYKNIKRLHLGISYSNWVKPKTKKILK